jgi:hypothetical protein
MVNCAPSVHTSSSPFAEIAVGDRTVPNRQMTSGRGCAWVRRGIRHNNSIQHPHDALIARMPHLRWLHPYYITLSYHVSRGREGVRKFLSQPPNHQPAHADMAPYSTTPTDPKHEPSHTPHACTQDNSPTRSSSARTAALSEQQVMRGGLLGDLEEGKGEAEGFGVERFSPSGRGRGRS